MIKPFYGTVFDLVCFGQALPLLIKLQCYKFRVNFLLMKKLLHTPRAFIFPVKLL